MKYQEKNICFHEKPARKNVRPTKAQRYNGTRRRRPKKALEPRNLAHSVLGTEASLFKKHPREPASKST